MPHYYRYDNKIRGYGNAQLNERKSKNNNRISNNRNIYEVSYVERLMCMYVIYTVRVVSENVLTRRLAGWL